MREWSFVNKHVNKLKLHTSVGARQVFSTLDIRRLKMPEALT